MKSKNIRCLKFFLVVFSSLCTFLAFILISVCLINIVYKQPLIEQSPMVGGVVSVSVILGPCLIVAALIVCICALRQQVKVLYVYSTFYLFLVVLEWVFVIGGALLSAWGNNNSELRMYFYRNTTTIEDEVTDYQRSWDNLQFERQCCGVDGPQDYNIINRDIPAACCARAYPLREGNARRHLHSICLTERTYYTSGCEQVVREREILKSKIIIAASVVFTLFEIVCVTLGIHMIRAIRAERRRRQANLQAHFES